MKKIIMLFVFLVMVQESICMQKITVEIFSEDEKDAAKILSLLNKKNSKPKSVTSVDKESQQSEQNAELDKLKKELEDVIIGSDDEGWADN